MASSKDSYEVGYAKPPLETRFTKGRSGNPKGRPKGSQNLATILAKVARERVTVKSKNGTRTITKLEAAIIQLSNQAASGQLRAIREFLQWAKSTEESEKFSSALTVPHERDQEVMASILKRIRESSDATPEESGEDSSEAPAIAGTESPAPNEE